ncbi:MAG: hypothetical protein C0514_04225 [Candidatus Puniceispirillum sp.]|nr:hypothetical protein [Candidatus Puniceispirillum sp.]
MGTFTAATLLASSPAFATIDAVQEGPLTKQQTQELDKAQQNIKKLTAVKSALAEVEKTLEVAVKQQKEAGEKKGAGDAKPADTPTEHTDKKDAAPEATGGAAVAPAAEAH